MGVDYEARVVIGVRLDEILECRTVTERVRVFNRATGVPEEEERTREELYLLGRPCPEQDIDRMDRLLGLKVYGVWEASGGDLDRVAGVSVALVDTGGIVAVDPIDELEAVRTVQARLRELAERFGPVPPGVTIRRHLILAVG